MKFDVAIIGGGIIGSAAAFFLARDGGAARIAMIEADPSYACATTPQGAGGVRQLFSRPENVAMSQYSLRFYENFAANVGDDTYQPDIDFRKQGYLFVVGEDGAETLERNAALQTSMDVRAELLDVSALRLGRMTSSSPVTRRMMVGSTRSLHCKGSVRAPRNAAWIMCVDESLRWMFRGRACGRQH